MTKVAITSDARQKLNKIRDGDVFDSPLVFVTELLQNSYRAGAKTVYFEIKEGGFLIADDGCGCKTPRPVLTLDYSEWNSTDEGFGIGLWSFLAVPGLTRAVISSGAWEAVVDVDNIFATGSPEAEVSTIPSMRGFKVVLLSPFFSRDGGNIEKIWSEIKRVGELQPFDIFVNGEKVSKKNILADVRGEWVKEYNNSRFSARFAITEKSWETPVLYYERRKVCSFPEIWNTTGIIEMNGKALNLKAPDRTSVVRNEKFERFAKNVKSCVEDLYMDFLKNATDNKLVDRYAKSIDSVLSVDQFEKFITVDGVNMVEHNTTSETAPAMASASISAVVPVGVNPEDYEVEDESITSPIVGRAVFSTQKPRGVLLKDVIKKNKKVVWMRAEELESSAELKAKAEYYRIVVHVANNILQERVYQKHNVPHISELENGVEKTITINNRYLKTEKEISFMRILNRISAYYNLDHKTFQIGDLKLVVTTKLGGMVIDKETLRVGGVAYENHIVLDRKHLGLKRFHLYGEGIGQHELKALLANITTIAHELAHRLYGTTDNTVMHYKSEEQIRDEIAKIFINL
jgi:hypothetical protein